ncbi:hypothetical protein GORBP_084_00100 [Gordonia rubripertincta NBRC 101908]|uniref:Uncharacterized protein n=1 Tax=Gordonia rubripertincta NBRC 101908 TaxID=1077975 RepID=A0ABQ0HXD0_GORRU|nr:hypothetical protein GORBP_084_00100 [Gordonia rubripertincta NBRC 101908]
MRGRITQHRNLFRDSHSDTCAHLHRPAGHLVTELSSHHKTVATQRVDVCREVALWGQPTRPVSYHVLITPKSTRLTGAFGLELKVNDELCALTSGNRDHISMSCVSGATRD